MPTGTSGAPSTQIRSIVQQRRQNNRPQVLVSLKIAEERRDVDRQVFLEPGDLGWVAFEHVEEPWPRGLARARQIRCQAALHLGVLVTAQVDTRQFAQLPLDIAIFPWFHAPPTLAGPPRSQVAELLDRLLP